MAPTPALSDELIEQFLLRLPPTDPASLIDGALVCKSWGRFICSPRFRHEFQKFHRKPPMLGFFCNIESAQFFPTSSFRLPQAALHSCIVLDARHGRVLLERNVMEDEDNVLTVWDPTIDKQWDLPQLDIGEQLAWHATVICRTTTSGSCNDRDCHDKPFKVISLGLGIEPEHMSSLHIYSSEVGSWSDPTMVPKCDVDTTSTALVGNTLHFLTDDGIQILSYDMETRERHFIHLPLKLSECSTALMEMENGVLGVARLDEAGKLTLWLSEVHPNGDLKWAQIKFIELEKVLPINGRSIYFNYIGFAHGTGVFFVGTDDGIFTFDLKSGQAKKVFNDPCDGYGVNIVVPYVSFCTPALRTIDDIGEELEVDAANA